MKKGAAAAGAAFFMVMVATVAGAQSEDQPETSLEKSPLSVLGESVRTEWDGSLDPATVGKEHPKAPPDLYGRLGFERSTAVSIAVQADFAQAAAGGASDDDAALRAALASGRALLSFDRLLSGAGYSGTNLLDVTAAYLLRSWELVHDRSLGPPGTLLTPMRFQLMRAFAANPGLVELNDAEQQRAAEYLVYSITFDSQLQAVLGKSANAEAQERLRESAANSALAATGFDLTRCHPGPNGLMPDSNSK